MNAFTKLKWPLILVVLLISLSSLNLLRADDDDDEEHHEGKAKIGGVYKINNRADFQLPINQKWKAECSSCHMLYLPGLLPARSWTKMMSTLKNHFGENAELDPMAQKEITDFLVQNSSDRVHTRRGDKILSSIGSNEEIQRISETTYFKRKHDEINSNVYKRKSIGSPANCIACHPGAEKGNFSEENVRIPKDIPAKIK
ncbi:MAG: cytochrome C [Alphaproteobacteria bacterium]|nr:MAG: cytochrome C [Alphaproteobacteria bacterium]